MQFLQRFSWSKEHEYVPILNILMDLPEYTWTFSFYWAYKRI